MNQLLLPVGLSGLLMLTPQPHPEKKVTLLDLAAESGSFSTLVAAVEAADLSEALGGEGPFTVFAPTDEAFAELGEEVLARLLSEEGRPQLTQLLTHHVVPGLLPADEVVRRSHLSTLAETDLDVRVALGQVLVGEAAVDTADLRASNGVIHVIDRVLLPPQRSATLVEFLQGTITRGVALFNSGDERGCCAVYATALEALHLGRGFGLAAWQRERIGNLAQRAEWSPTSDRNLAWAYREIIDTVLRGELERPEPGEEAFEARRVIFGFEEAREVRSWRTVLDGVMGGLSTGRIRQGPGTLVFDGETSLENNGGFSSMRCELEAGALRGAESLRLRVKGDGRTYILGVRGSSRMGADSYWTRFETVDGEWMTVEARIDEMKRHFYGRRVPGRVTPSQVRGLEVYVYDKKSGPFRLEVDEIHAF